MIQPLISSLSSQLKCESSISLHIDHKICFFTFFIEQNSLLAVRAESQQPRSDLTLRWEEQCGSPQTCLLLITALNIAHHCLERKPFFFLLVSNDAGIFRNSRDVMLAPLFSVWCNKIFSICIRRNRYFRVVKRPSGLRASDVYISAVLLCWVFLFSSQRSALQLQLFILLFDN